MLYLRVSTGIEKIDSATEGGFERGSNIILYGPPMSGKSQFITEFALNAILKGEVVIYVTTNETYGQIQEKIEKHDSEVTLPHDNFIFIDCYSALLSSIRDSEPPKNYLSHFDKSSEYRANPAGPVT